MREKGEAAGMGLVGARSTRHAGCAGGGLGGCVQVTPSSRRSPGFPTSPHSCAPASPGTCEVCGARHAVEVARAYALHAEAGQRVEHLGGGPAGAGAGAGGGHSSRTKRCTHGNPCRRLVGGETHKGRVPQGLALPPPDQWGLTCRAGAARRSPWPVAPSHGASRASVPSAVSRNWGGWCGCGWKAAEASTSGSSAGSSGSAPPTL